LVGGQNGPKKSWTKILAETRKFARALQREKKNLHNRPALNDWHNHKI
jgi:hypothetical protein